MSADKTHWMGRMGRWLRLHMLRAVRENASPARTALGLALGAFIGIFPTFLIGTPLAFFVAGRLSLNRAAAVAGTIISVNPLTAPGLYWLSAWLGLKFRRPETEMVEVEGLFNMIREYGGAFLLGNAVVAASGAILLGGAMWLLVRRKGPKGMKSWLSKPKRYRPASADVPTNRTSAEVRQLP